MRTKALAFALQAESDVNFAPEEVVQEEERLRKEREEATKGALQVTSCSIHSEMWRQGCPLGNAGKACVNTSEPSLCGSTDIF